jgi:hypothetical protein
MMEPLSVGVHSVANLGEFKSDQVSSSVPEDPTLRLLISGLYRIRSWSRRTTLHGRRQGPRSQASHCR